MAGEKLVIMAFLGGWKPADGWIDRIRDRVDRRPSGPVVPDPRDPPDTFTIWFPIKDHEELRPLTARVAAALNVPVGTAFRYTDPLPFDQIFVVKRPGEVEN